MTKYFFFSSLIPEIIIVFSIYVIFNHAGFGLAFIFGALANITMLNLCFELYGPINKDIQRKNLLKICIYLIITLLISISAIWLIHVYSGYEERAETLPFYIFFIFLVHLGSEVWVFYQFLHMIIKTLRIAEEGVISSVKKFQLLKWGLIILFAARICLVIDLLSTQHSVFGYSAWIFFSVAFYFIFKSFSLESPSKN